MAYWLLFFLITLLALAWLRAGIRVTSLALGAATLFFGLFGGSTFLFLLMALAGALVFVPLNLPVLRQEWFSRPLFAGFKRVLSRLDERQLAAIKAGDAGWEAELFDGQPDWPRFHERYSLRLTVDERALLSGPVAEFCGRFAADPETPDAAARLRGFGLHGLGIDAAHGGLGLSALAQAAALGRLSAGAGSALALRLGSAARTTWIELLRRHGDAAQQSRWLPKLAAGATLQVAEAALAGDAVVGDGEEGLALILSLTLAIDSDAELVGVCIDVRDPQGRLAAGERLGATYLLMEATALRAGTKNVAVAFDAVIGGRDRLGCAESDGVDCRAVADAVAHGAIHAGTITVLALAAGSAANLRTPFGTAVGEQALAQEALATLGARAYAGQALAAVTARAVDLGETPLGPAAFARSLTLAQARDCTAAATDLGYQRSILQKLITALDDIGRDAAAPPLLARADDYSACVLRSHGAFMAALVAAQTLNPAQALERFDRALWSHVGHLFGSAAQAFALGLTSGSRVFFGRTPESLYLRRINRYSAALAFAADVSLSLLARDLGSHTPYTALRAVREASRRSLTTSLGDALAQLYLASAALRQFDEGGAIPAERALLELICTAAFGAVEEALDRLLRRLSSPTLAWLIRVIVLPLGRSRVVASEATQRAVATQLQHDSPLRERFAARGSLPADASPWPLLEAALEAMRAAAAIEQRAMAATQPAPARYAPARIAQALAGGAIDDDEAEKLLRWRAAVMRFGKSSC